MLAVGTLLLGGVARAQPSSAGYVVALPDQMLTGVPWWLALPVSAAAVVVALVWMGGPVVEATDALIEPATATA